MENNYKFSIAIVAPIIRPIDVMEEYTRTLPLALEQLSKLSGLLKIPLYWSATQPPIRIDVLDEPNDIQGFTRIWSPSNPRRYVFLRFSVDADVNVDDAEIDWGTSNRSPTEKMEMTRNLVYTWVIEEIGFWIYHLLTATIIALPASIQAEAMTAIINDGIYHEAISNIVRCPHEAVEFAMDNGWPPVRDIPVSTVWEWFRGLPGIETGIVSGPTGRAVASLTYIVFGDSGISDLSGNLIWASLGLEAIYGREAVGIGEQLREKAELLLGRYDGIRKRIANAYDFRSRFLHGDLNLPFQYMQYVESDQIINLHSDDHEATLFMEVLLISTLQELVRRNVHDISFSYKVSS